KFTVVPIDNENLTVDYIPKVQARKLYQLAKEAMEKYQNQSKAPESPIPSADNQKNQDAREYQSFKLQPEEEPILKEAEKPAEEEDELTLKLKKLKTLFDKQLISKEE